MRMLKQSTAANVMVLMVDSADHVTGKAGLTLTITASKDGGAFNSITPTVSDRGSGWYNLALTTSHTDTLGDLAIHITSTGADPSDFYAWVVVRHLADLAFPATTGRSLAVESDGMVYADAREWLGSAPLALSSQLVQALAADIAAGAITSSEAPALANLDAAVSTRALEAGGNVAAIKTKTDNLPSDPADESLLEAAIAAVQADTNDIQTRLPAALVSGRVDASVGAMAAGAIDAAAIGTGAIDADALAADAGTEIAAAVWATVGALGKAYGLMVAENNAAQIIRVGQFQAGSTTQALVLDASASAIDDFYNRTTITIVTGTYAGQNRLINDYVGATKTAYLDRPLLGGAPTASDFFAIDSRGNTRSASDLSIGLAQSGAAGYITLQSNALAIDDFYNRMFVLIESGTGEGQARLITDYTGASKQADVARNWVTAPDATSRYVILPFGSVKVSEIDSDVIDADAIAADAITEIQSGLATSASLATVQADTDDIQTRLPAVLVSGRIDASVGAMASDTLTASALTAGAVDEILDEVIEGTTTLREALRIMFAALANKSSGGGTATITFQDIADSKARITATVDSSGNRTAVTVDGS